MLLVPQTPRVLAHGFCSRAELREFDDDGWNIDVRFANDTVCSDPSGLRAAEILPALISRDSADLLRPVAFAACPNVYTRNPLATCHMAHPAGGSRDAMAHLATVGETALQRIMAQRGIAE